MKQREKTVPKKKEPKPKKERTPKEATALMLGVVALVLAILAIASGYFLPVLVPHYSEILRYLLYWNI